MSITELPNECLQYILSFLPISQLNQLQCVNRLWFTLVNDANFVRTAHDSMFLRDGANREPTLSDLVSKAKNLERWTRISLSEQDFDQALHWLWRACKPAIIASVCKTNEMYLLKTLLFAAQRGDAEFCQMVTNHLDANARAGTISGSFPANRFTPLHTAVYFSNESVIDWLLSHGANLEARERAFQQTPLLVAVQRSPLHIVEKLIAASADVTAVDRDRMSLLILATRNCDRRVYDILEQNLRPAPEQ